MQNLSQETIAIHQLDKRLDGVEQKCAFFNEKLHENNNSINSRLDRLDENICGVNEQLTTISEKVSKNEGAIDARRKFWLATSSCIGILVGMGLHEPLFKIMGIN